MLPRLCFLLVLLVPFSLGVASEEIETESYPPAEGAVEPYDLRLEFLSEPRGIDERSPRFSWKLRSDDPGQLQSAYRIVVYRTRRSEPDLLL